MTIQLKDLVGAFLLYCGVAPLCGWLVHVALIGGV